MLAPNGMFPRPTGGNDRSRPVAASEIEILPLPTGSRKRLMKARPWPRPGSRTAAERPGSVLPEGPPRRPTLTEALGVSCSRATTAGKPNPRVAHRDHPHPRRPRPARNVYACHRHPSARWPGMLHHSLACPPESAILNRSRGLHLEDPSSAVGSMAPRRPGRSSRPLVHVLGGPLPAVNVPEAARPTAGGGRPSAPFRHSKQLRPP